MKAIFFLITMVVSGSVFADPASQSFSPPESLKPFETKMNFGLFGILGGSMEYSLDGKRISRYEDFKSRIYPLGDAEASGLIREAESNHIAAMILYFSGAAVGADLALFFKPNRVLNIDWFDRIATGFGIGQIFVAVGALFDTSADSRKYNAVQRYNHLVRHPQEVSLDLTPQWSPSNNSLNLILSRSF